MPIERLGHDPEDESEGGETALHSASELQRAAPPSRPQVTWSDPAGAHSVELGETTIAGSSSGAGLVVRDRTVSRLHAEFSVRDDGLWVRDLGSTNGTFVEGIRIESARVPDGATIRIGSTSLLVQYGATSPEVDIWPTNSFGPCIGRSTSMRALFARLARIAPTDASVLIQGETGTGKDLVANAIHLASNRASRPLVIVDCAALPAPLLEAELFGHTRGAFTGAIGPRAGAIESAHGGTVFLDEIGELALPLQPKLLRVVESRTIRRIGETNYRDVDVRFISATNRDLVTMVNAGSFREDLYFRLAVLPVRIPPLRERPEDIPPLVEHFLTGTDTALSGELLTQIASRPWFGNVRDLRNFVERVVALGAREAVDLLPKENGEGGPEARDGRQPSYDQPLRAFREQWLEHLEREYLVRLLTRHDRNVAEVAKSACVDRTYIYRMMRKYGL